MQVCVCVCVCVCVSGVFSLRGKDSTPPLEIYIYMLVYACIHILKRQWIKFQNETAYLKLNVQAKSHDKGPPRDYQ